VTIIGPVNMPSLAPQDASQMYATNLIAFLKPMVKDGALAINRDDEIIRETLVTYEGKVVHPKVRELLGPEVTV
jgi:NAD(P) transhydrogenase subunit alpha